MLGQARSTSQHRRAVGAVRVFVVRLLVLEGKVWITLASLKLVLSHSWKIRNCLRTEGGEREMLQSSRAMALHRYKHFTIAKQLVSIFYYLLFWPEMATIF